MTTNQSTNPRLRDTLRNDLKQLPFTDDRRRDWRNIKEFYLFEEQKERLKTTSAFKSFFLTIWWIFKSMILKLSPFRRLLVIIGLILIISARNVTVNGESVEVSNSILIATFLFLLVILLELKDKLLARDELEAGRRVQRALTPERNPNFEGWQIYIFTQSANEVGGDLVDFLLTDPKRALIALADISGKGLQAALMMAKLQAMIRALASYVQPLDNLVSHINFIFHRDSLPSTFASLLYVDISSESGELNYVNAGHFPPLLLQNNEIRELAKGELAIGLQSNSQYTLNTIQLNSGDLFIGYSDGIIESKNEAGEFYGVDRFFPVLKSSVGLTAEQLGERVILNVKQFVHNAQANDDMSLIIIKKI